MQKCPWEELKKAIFDSNYSRNLLQSLAQISILYFFWSRPILSALRTFPWTDCEDFEDCASGGLQATWDTVCSQIEFSSRIQMRTSYPMALLCFSNVRIRRKFPFSPSLPKQWKIWRNQWENKFNLNFKIVSFFKDFRNYLRNLVQLSRKQLFFIGLSQIKKNICWPKI